MSTKSAPVKKPAAKKTAAKSTPAGTAMQAAKAQPVTAATAKNQPDTTQAFLREVDDALQQEKLLNLWQTYRFIAIGAVGALLLSVIGWQVWQGTQASHMRTVAKDWYSYSSISADNSPAKSELRNKIEKEGSPGYRALALLAEADAAPDAATAATAYAKIYNDGKQPGWLRELARLNAGLRQMGTDDTAAQAQFEKLATYPDPREASAAAAVALEQLAVLALAKGDPASAKGYTEKLLQIPYLMADMRQRAQKRLGALQQ